MVDTATTQQPQEKKPLLDLSTQDREYKSIKIDGKNYQVLNIDDISLKEYSLFKDYGNKLTNQDLIITNPEDYEKTINSMVCLILPALEEEKLTALSLSQKNAILTAFTQEAFPGTATTPAEIVPNQ